MSISAITLYGEQIVDYIWVRNGQLSDEELETILDVQTPDNSFEFGQDTLMLARYNNSLSAGTLETDNEIVGWDIYKRKEDTTQLQFVKSIDITADFIVDHLIENGKRYVYYIFPKGETTMGTPIVSDPVASKVWNWVLFTATESTEQNVLIATHAYIFQGNVDSGSLSNNGTSSVMNNFTQYPKIIKGTQNYKSGILKALIGVVDLQTNKYAEFDGLRDALLALSTSQERMFLKNRAGDIWEVTVHNTITMEVNDISPLQLNTVSLPWTEIANATDLSLISMEELADE